MADRFVVKKRVGPVRYIKNRRHMRRGSGVKYFVFGFIFAVLLIAGIYFISNLDLDGAFPDFGDLGDYTSGFSSLFENEVEQNGNIKHNMDPNTFEEISQKNDPASYTLEDLRRSILSNGLVYDLPEKSQVSLIVGEAHLSLIRNDVLIARAENPDISIRLPSVYRNIIVEEGLCVASNKARVNGDFSFDTALSQSELIWKFRGMLKYKECLGI